ncbi:MAG: fibronectin type III domain-containing protein, partial [Gemmatimonadales bacterium]
AAATTQMAVSLPAAPSNLVASAVSSSQINLSWTDNASNESGFRIERCIGASCTSFAEIATVGVNATSYQNSSLSASTSYSYRVQTYNTGGNSAYSNTAAATTQAAVSLPGAPSNLVASAVSSSQINLSWTDNATNESGFKIEQCVGMNCTSFTEIAIVGAGVTSFPNTGLGAATRYGYRVRAYNAAGTSAYSNAVSVGTLWPPPVLQAPSISGTSITLTWTFTWPTFAATGEGYRLEQSTTSPTSAFTEILQIAGRTSPQSTTLTRSAGTYYFRVRVFVNQGAANYSDYSSVQTAVVAASAPAAPSNLIATAVSGSQINLSWADNATNESGFRIERCAGASCTTFAEIATVGANASSYQNINLSASTSYRYRVRAYNGVGTSAYSNIAGATTLGTTATRFQNNASYPIVYLTVDGVQYLTSSPQMIPPGYYYEIPLAAGSHSFEARTGFWNSDGSRFEMYVYPGTFTQQSGVTGTIPINDPTIQQLLTRFGTSGYWAGEYWTYNPVVFHYKAFRFYQNGTYDLYNDGVKVGSGTYSLVSRSPSTFSVTFTVGSYQGTLNELYGYFTMRNGPPDWPLIQYNYQGP